MIGGLILVAFLSAVQAKKLNHQPPFVDVDSGYHHHDPIEYAVPELVDPGGVDGSPLAFLCNVAWLVLGGCEMGTGWLCFALPQFVCPCTYPCAWQSVKIGCFVLWPFGRKIKASSRTVAGSSASCLCNTLWIPFGCCLSVGHTLFAICNCITIVLIPFGWQHWRLAGLALCPFGVDISPGPLGI